MSQLHTREVHLPYQVLTSKEGIYFSSIVLSMWDNIHGPKVLMTWKGTEFDDNFSSAEEDSECAIVPDEKSSLAKALPVSSNSVSDNILLAIANFTLNDEAGRIEKLDGIETKFYCLKKFNVIASVSVFSIEASRGKFEVFSFILILPYSEMTEFLPRHPVCESQVQRLLKKHLIIPLRDLVMERSTIHSKVCKVLLRFHAQLFKFTQVMISIRKFGLPGRIEVPMTYLGMESSKLGDMRMFLNLAISAHLQSSGYSVVLGSDKSAVDKMIMTLALLLSTKEKKMSRLIWQASDGPRYEPDLFLQGLLLSNPNSGILPFTKGDLYLNKLPPTIILLDSKEVFVFESNIARFIRLREDEADERQVPPRRSELLHIKELTAFNKDLVATTVREFIDHVFILPPTLGVKESYICQFHKQIRMKALTLTKYVDAEPKLTMQEFTAEFLALGRGANVSDRPRINQACLQQDLSIETAGDLYVILGFAEKIRPMTRIDVLGDPQLSDLAMIHEFQNF